MNRQEKKEETKRRGQDAMFEVSEVDFTGVGHRWVFVRQFCGFVRQGKKSENGQKGEDRLAARRAVRASLDRGGRMVEEGAWFGVAAAITPKPSVLVNSFFAVFFALSARRGW